MRALATPRALISVLLQVVYDEGPLYIFSPTEELRKRWIHQLKSGEWGALQPPGKPPRALGCACASPAVPGSQGL